MNKPLPSWKLHSNGDTPDPSCWNGISRKSENREFGGYELNQKRQELEMHILHYFVFSFKPRHFNHYHQHPTTSLPPQEKKRKS